jgi:hypothetical protein
VYYYELLWNRRYMLSEFFEGNLWINRKLSTDIKSLLLCTLILLAKILNNAMLKWIFSNPWHWNQTSEGNQKIVLEKCMNFAFSLNSTDWFTDLNLDFASKWASLRYITQNDVSTINDCNLNYRPMNIKYSFKNIYQPIVLY